jgi:hypothetical protein
MLKRHEVEILLRTGHAQTEVARLAGVSLCSVKRIEEAPVVHVDDAAKRDKRRIREAGYPGGKTALYALVASLRPKEVKLSALARAPHRTHPRLTAPAGPTSVGDPAFSSCVSHSSGCHA